jgi:predicted GIY-YIG superfamily endonuclease
MQNDRLMNNDNLDLQSNEHYEEPFEYIHKYLFGFSFVYAIINTNNQIYIGYTKNPYNRIIMHNKNIGAKATRNKGPWKLFNMLCYASDNDARNAEIYYRRNPYELVWRSKLSIALISDEFEHNINLDDLTFL